MTLFCTRESNFLYSSIRGERLCSTLSQALLTSLIFARHRETSDLLHNLSPAM